MENKKEILSKKMRHIADNNQDYKLTTTMQIINGVAHTGKYKHEFGMLEDYVLDYLASEGFAYTIIKGVTTVTW